MKTLTVTHRNGIALAETIAVNPRLIIKYWNNSSTKCVIRLDVEPGSKTQPVSYTLDVDKSVIDAMMATDQTINLITANVLNPATGATTSTTFNEAYLVSLKDTKAVINGVLDTSVVEFIYSDGGFQNKTLLIDGALSALVASNAAEILTYSFASVPGSSAVINAAERTIATLVPAGTTVTAIAATFTKSAGLSSIKVGATPQVSASTTNDFSDPIVYTLVAQDGITTRTWTVTNTIDVGHLAVMLTMTHASQVGSTVIDDTAGTITMHMPSGTNVTAFVMTFTVSPNATVKIGTTAQVSGVTANDFTTAKTYVVTSEDELTTKSYVATVIVD